MITAIRLTYLRASMGQLVNLVALKKELLRGALYVSISRTTPDMPQKYRVNCNPANRCLCGDMEHVLFANFTDEIPTLYPFCLTKVPLQHIRLVSAWFSCRVLAQVNLN